MDSNVPQGVTAFQYSPLPDAAAYVRLLQVLDDAYSEDIKVRCKMTTWPLDNTPPYRAISYTWGDPKSPSVVLVNDQAFRVRTNCEFVLKQAYWYEKTSYYWVDAICINQEDLAEKGMQVSRMGNVYKQAVKVLACVGDHADYSELLVQMLKQRAFTKKVFPWGMFMRISSRFKLRKTFSTTMRLLHAAVHFLERPYFTRLWILQELRISREAIFLCGSDTIPRSAIYDMAEAILTYSLDTPRHGRFAQAAIDMSRSLLFMRRLCSVQVFWSDYRQHSRDLYLTSRFTSQRVCLVVGSKSELDDLLWAATELECEERKDKIFGLMALLPWAVAAPTTPDYTQTKLQVACSFLKDLFNHWYQGGYISNTGYDLASAFVVSVLGLDRNSTGVAGAVESRQPEQGNDPGGGIPNAIYTHTRHEYATGWRVTGEHLTKNEAGFSTWNPPGSHNCNVHLPFWTNDGDWIIMTRDSKILEQRFVLVREDIEGLGGPLIGRAVSMGFQIKDALGTRFGIHWDPDDFVISSILDGETPWYEDEDSGSYSAEWVRALNTAVCSKDNPGSSYAFRCDVVSCEDVGSWGPPMASGSNE